MDTTHSTNMATLDRWASLRGPASAAPTLTLADLGHLDCSVVETDGQRQRWDTLLTREHWLGPGPLVGARLRYLIRSEFFGDVAALSFSAPALRLSARDAFIGWDDATRGRLLSRIVCNSRLALSGHVQVENLASHVLALVLRQLPDDWQAQHGMRPVLVETFIDRTRHRGGAYRAANWTYVGDTRGRGRNDRQHERSRSIKAIYVYPLHKQWRQQLGIDQPPDYTPGEDDWARHEFAHLKLHDKRLKERVMTVSRAFMQHSTGSMPQATGSRAANQAACRLFANQKVTMDALLDSHYVATASRCRPVPITLALQDTTTLNYSAHPLMAGLGPIGTKASGAQGLIVHDTLMVTPAGTPLGLIDLQCWARDPETHGQRRLGKPSDFDNKESGKWLDSHHQASKLQQSLETTQVVSVCDREGDIYELLLAAQSPDAADVLVRSKHDRTLVEPDQCSMTEHLARIEPIGAYDLPVPRRGNQKARTARMAIRCTRVTIQPPKNKPHLPNITLDVVQAIETRPPDGIKPLNWTLLTTVPTTTLEQAHERISWYARRWDIEVYHRTLKSGCRIEDRQFGTASRLEACLAIDLVVAWRVMLLNRQCRETPDAPCTVHFRPEEWKALWIRTGSGAMPSDDEVPTLREAVRRVASLGGFLGRKSDGEPGTQTLWQGLQRLDDITRMYEEMLKILGGEHRQGAP